MRCYVSINPNLPENARHTRQRSNAIIEAPLKRIREKRKKKTNKTVSCQKNKNYLNIINIVVIHVDHLLMASSDLPFKKSIFTCNQFIHNPDRSLFDSKYHQTGTSNFSFMQVGIDPYDKCKDLRLRNKHNLEIIEKEIPWVSNDNMESIVQF